MRRTFAIVVLVMLCFGQMRGQGERRILYRADMGYYDEVAYPGAQRLIGNVKFKRTTTSLLTATPSDSSSAIPSTCTATAPPITATSGRLCSPERCGLRTGSPTF